MSIESVLLQSDKADSPEAEESNTLYQSAYELVSQRNAYYKLAHHRILITLLVSIVFNVTIGIILYWLIVTKVPPVYFPTDPQGRLLSEEPLSDPVLTDKEIQAYVITAAKAVTSFDYMNYRADLQNAREYFTDAGFEDYVKALNASRNLKTVLSQKLVSRGELSGKPTLTQGKAGERVIWKVEIPMNIRYESQSLTIVQPVIAQALVGRVSTTESLYAVQIAQLIFKDRLDEEETKETDKSGAENAEKA